jgi:hypothetical protein
MIAKRSEFFVATGMAGKPGSADFTVPAGVVAVLGLRFGGAAFTSIPTTSR